VPRFSDLRGFPIFAKKMPMHFQLSVLIPEVLHIARKAGAEIMEIYNSAADIEVENKNDNTPITLADRASNKIICERLTELTPEWPIISEESRLPAFQDRSGWDYCWIIDPLDGTKEFIQRNGQFTVNIALASRGKAVLGILYAPATGACFWAVEGEGAWEILPDASQNRLQCNTFDWADKGLRVLSSKSHFNTATQALIDQLDSPEFVSRGSALKFGMLARGEADVYFRLGPTGEWDTAAGQIIVEEAGGAVVKYPERTPLQYNKENTLNPHFIAYGVIRSEPDSEIPS
jgi:3'(2'), 5'-bisphosphate nucleotidase